MKLRFPALAILLFAATAMPLASATPGGDALAWVKAHQQANGAIVDAEYAEHQTALPLLALVTAEGEGENATAAAGWLAAKLNNPNAWFYGSWGEADVPSVMLWAVSQAGKKSLVDEATVRPKVYSFRNASNGGFKGYYDALAAGAVESSADTALAVLGLQKAGWLEGNASSAIAFIETLQNEDGSINLTGREKANALYSLAPDGISTTALFVIAADAVGTGDAAVANAVAFLKTANASGKAYSLALATVALKTKGENSAAAAKAAELAQLQKQDGGFADARRSSTASNGIDTGAAALAFALAGGAGAGQARVGMVTAFPNGTTTVQCITVQEGATAEQAMKASGWATEWMYSTLGGALTKISAVGCLAGDAWCECRTETASTCCLLWNLWKRNPATGAWEFSSVGYSAMALHDGDVFGQVWTSDYSRQPPVVSFAQACPASGTPQQTTSAVDAATCGSCTENWQCASSHCVHGACRPAAAYCGDGYCDGGESCTLCNPDCACTATTVTTTPTPATASATATPTPAANGTTRRELGTPGVVTITPAPQKKGMALVAATTPSPRATNFNAEPIATRETTIQTKETAQPQEAGSATGLATTGVGDGVIIAAAVIAIIAAFIARTALKNGS